MDQKEKDILELLKNDYFVKWVISPTEELDYFWSKWIASHPERAEHVRRARQILTSLGYERDISMPSSDFDMVLEHIVSYSRQKRNHERSFNVSWKPFAVAASVIVAVFLSFMALDFQDESNAPLAEVETVVKKTDAGQKLIINLPDNTKVTLNAETVLTYRLPFVNNREVSLSGEAFFDVTRDEQHPFVITSGNFKTKVLGTSFNVQAYPNQDEGFVAVVEGKVEVSDDQGNHAHLIPDVRGVFKASERRLLLEPFSRDEVIGWKDGVLAFEKTPVSEVFSRLERWYGVRIKLHDKQILSGEYTGVYKHASLEKVLEGMALTMDFSFSIQNHEVVIK